MPLRIRRGAFGAAVFLLAVTGSIGGTLWYSQHSRSTDSAAASTSAVVGAAGAAPATGIDFSQDQAANYEASQLGQRLLADLPPLAGYAGLQIVRYGIEVDVVGAPSEAIRAAVARDGTQYQGKPIPVRYRSVRHTQQELQAVADRLEADQGYWQQQGIELTSWGVEIQSNTVQVTMAHYTKAFRDALLDRYGSSLVSVVPKDVVPTGG
jgi:hypothetical protein